MPLKRHKARMPMTSTLQPHLLVRQERRRPANKSLHPCYPITLQRAKEKGEVGEEGDEAAGFNGSRMCGVG